MSSLVENEIRKKIQSIQQDTDGAILIVLKTDNVGLLKDTKIPNPIPQEPTTNEPRIAINKDNVGLAKDATLSSVLPRNLTQISGTSLTARDWSSDFAKLQNIDVLLSSRASESTLSAIKNALASVATDKLRVSPVDPFPTSPINITQISGTVLTARDWSGDLAKLQNLDTALSVLFNLIRWGRNVSPLWVQGSEVTAPAAGTALVSKTVSTGKSGFIYGFFISAGEANDFKVNWTSGGTAYSKRIVLGGKGSIQYADFIAFNEGLPADAGTSVTITNVNAGSTGVVYQAAILYAEV